MHHPANENILGAAMGSALGIIKSLTMFSMISWEAAFDTVILGALGAGGGLIVTGAWKLIKKKFFKS